MPLCIDYTKDRRRCANRAVHDDTRCGIHRQTYAANVARANGVHHVQGTCVHFHPTNHWCNQPAINNDTLCQAHHDNFQERNRAINQRHEEARLRRVTTNIVLAEYHVRGVPWHQAVDELWTREHLTEGVRSDVATRLFREHDVRVRIPLGPFEHIFVDYVAWVRGGRVGDRPNTALPDPVAPAAARAPELGRIALDRQNVHTRIVSEQTNKIQAKLFEKGGDTNKRLSQFPKMAIATWLMKGWLSFDRLPDLSRDLHRFYSLKMVRQENDYLYRRMFNAAATIIKNEPDRERQMELTRRLCEECVESIGMCAEGHLTRLCNVFVGFDDAFQPPVAVGELLQQKIAAISTMDVPLEERLKQARAVFAELHIPDAEQAPWVEAIEAM